MIMLGKNIYCSLITRHLANMLVQHTYNSYLLLQMAESVLCSVPCQICQNQTAKFYCNTCGIALCTKCKTRHLKNKDAKVHIVVSYADKVDPNLIAQLFCRTHQGCRAELWCERCNMQICQSCSMNEHKEHEISNLIQKISEQRDTMVTELKTLRDHNMIEWEDLLMRAQILTNIYMDNIKSLDNELQTRAAKLHQQVDTILIQQRQTLQDYTTPIITKLQEQENYLSDRLHKIRREVERLEDHLIRPDARMFLNFKAGTLLNSYITPSSLDKGRLPVFIRRQIDTISLEAMLGQISSQKPTTASDELPSYEDLFKTQDTNASARNSITRSNISSTIGTLVPNPSTVSRFRMGYDYPNLVCTDSGNTWIKSGPKTLQLMDKTGSAVDSIIMESNFHGIAITVDGHLLIADHINKCVWSVSAEKTISMLFSTGMAPDDVCCLQNNDIVLVFRKDKKVIRYNNRGSVVKMYDNTHFRYPYSIAASKFTRDIYIIDHANDFNYNGRIVTISDDGDDRFIYPTQGKEKLYPLDACADLIGHVLVTDNLKHRVHILDHEGRFIQYVDTSAGCMTVDVDAEGCMWVGLGFEKCVKVYKYLQ